jgi:hypothetical protein
MSNTPQIPQPLTVRFLNEATRSAADSTQQFSEAVTLVREVKEYLRVFSQEPPQK